MSQLPMTDDRLVELARELPANTADADRVEAVRTSLLSSVGDRPQQGSSRSWLYVGTILAAAAAVLLFVAMQRGDANMTPVPLLSMTTEPTPAPSTAALAQHPARRAAVEASKAAHFVHTRGANGDEVVKLSEGALKVRVASLRANERFRVVAGDAEVEARGSAFNVAVTDKGLRSVTVHSGRVAIRVKGHKAVFLAAGESWSPTIAVVTKKIDDIVLPAPRPQPKPRPEQQPIPEVPELKPQPQPILASDAERAFQSGWASLRMKDYEVAATAFNRVVTLAADSNLAPDARYWLAISLARAGDTAKSRMAMQSFLRHHPGSARVGEVSTMLGWLHLKASRRGQAKRLFKTAINDVRADVRKSARAGLKALR